MEGSRVGVLTSEARLGGTRLVIVAWTPPVSRGNGIRCFTASHKGLHLLFVAEIFSKVYRNFMMAFLRWTSLARLLLLCPSLPQVFSAPAVVARADDPTVTIAAGVVVGTAVKPANQPSVTIGANAYLGVPFAKSPPERFSPPQVAPSWSAPLQAQTLKPVCVQQFSGTGKSRELTMQFFNNPLNLPPEGSEDCLYLNIWTPPGVTSTSSKAVMFWLFGV